MTKQQLDLVQSWVIWYNNCTPITARLSQPVVKSKVNYSHEALEAICIAMLRDKRDWDSIQWKLPGGKPQTAFQHLIHNWLRNRGYVGTIKANINSSTSWNIVYNTAISLWRALDTDLSHTLIELAEEGSQESWLMIARAKVNPHSAIYHNNSDLFYRDYQAVNFLRKYEGLSAVIKTCTETEALKSWLKAERQCKETNSFFLDGTIFTKDEQLQLYAVRSLVQRVLGAAPSLDQVRKSLKVGPGSTRSCPSKFCSIFDKIDSFKTSSLQAKATSQRILQGTFWDRELVVSEQSVLATVPKTALTGRTIEPPEDFDSQCQMALGTLIKARLKRFGLDIDHQATINADLAKAGSKHGGLATIDLASASDTIAYQVIKFLLPKGWFNWLARYRSHIVKISDPSGVDPEPISYRLNKFSAMGNGFTFELETLVFLCITLVACNLNHEKKLPTELVGVFGDDIICPSQNAMSVITLLQLFGFTTNEDKTFIDGPFRESCGADFFKGAPVRPYFLKKEIRDVTQLYNLANGVRRVSVRSLMYYGSDVRYRDVWKFVVSVIPKEWRFCGSSEYGDEVIWASPDDLESDFHLQFPIEIQGVWRGKRIRAYQRGINLLAYSPTTPLQAWFLSKEKQLSNSYKKRIFDILKLSSQEFREVHERWDHREPILVQREFRAANNTRKRYRLSDLSLSTKTDCPSFR